MVKARLEYKCRRCGDVFGTVTTSRVVASMVTGLLLSGQAVPPGLIGAGTPPMLFDVHECDSVPNGVGVADYVGFKLEPPFPGDTP